MARLRLQPLDSRELPSATLDVALTAPLGSTKGSVVAEFTPPIGSNKGSFTAGVTCDGVGTTYRNGSQGIIAILIG